MAQRTAPHADVTRNAVNLARAMTIALRSWGFYPPDHPAVGLAVDRLLAAMGEATAPGLMQLAVTPKALLLDHQPIEAPDLSVADCAALLHDRDILQLSLVTMPPEPMVRALLEMLSLDRGTRRSRGGPAAIWADTGDASILIDQIDYQEILERDVEEGAARRDATWKSIVRSIIIGRKTFTAEEQQRLLEISRDVGAIGELGNDCKEAFCTPEGSPLVTTQAATILAVYRHIASTVSALEPDRATDVIGSLALSASTLDPAIAAELLTQEDAATDAGGVASALKQAFDDQQVAMLLARAVSTPGHATGRLAQVLDTLAPDDTRRSRVLKLAGKLVAERDFGGRRPIDDIRRSLDELLLKYDEHTYVSAEYRGSMDQAGARAGNMAALALPPELDDWLETLGHESVRRLSGQLLMDLLANETSPERAAEVARDMRAFVEDLILAGAYADALPVVEALSAAAERQPPVSPDACRHARNAIGGSAAFGEATAIVGEQSPDEHAAFGRLVTAIGPATAGRLLAAYAREDGPATERLTALLVALGPSVIGSLQAGVDDARWFVQREVTRILGRVGTPAAVPLLQTLLRRSDPRVLQSAVSSLACIDDPSAARALHTVLKAATGATRAAVIGALVGVKDARVVPMLVRVLQDSNPYGDDHGLVLDTLAALATLRDDRALAPVAAVARTRRWLAWAKTRAVRKAALRTLRRIGTAKAQRAFDELAQSGDFFLRRLARSPAVLQEAQ